MPRTASIIGLLLIFLSGCLSGCAATPDQRANYLPDDFALGITILPGDASGDASMEAAWYVLTADGALHAGLGERMPQSPLPPTVRTLSRAQAAEIWKAATSAGLTAETPPGRRISPLAVESDGAIAIVEVRANESHRTFAAGPAQGQGVLDVVQRLRALAWAK